MAVIFEGGIITTSTNGVEQVVDLTATDRDSYKELEAEGRIEYLGHKLIYVVGVRNGHCHCWRRKQTAPDDTKHQWLAMLRQEDDLINAIANSFKTIPYSNREVLFALQEGLVVEERRRREADVIEMIKASRRVEAKVIPYRRFLKKLRDAKGEKREMLIDDLCNGKIDFTPVEDTSPIEDDFSYKMMIGSE